MGKLNVKRDTHKVVDGSSLVDDRNEADSVVDWDKELGEDVDVEMVEEERGSGVDDDPVGPTELPLLDVELAGGNTNTMPGIDVAGP